MKRAISKVQCLSAIDPLSEDDDDYDPESQTVRIRPRRQDEEELVPLNFNDDRIPVESIRWADSD